MAGNESNDYLGSVTRVTGWFSVFQDVFLFLKKVSYREHWKNNEEIKNNKDED